MLLHKKTAEYNRNETVLIISSYPPKGGESARQNAVANYTRELAQNMATHTPVVVVCEKLSDHPTIYKERNVLVVRAYSKGSLRMPTEIAEALREFPRVETIMVQFEFNIFGTPLSTSTFIPLLFSLKQKGKKITFVFHQVVDNLHELGEHLGLSAGFSLKTSILTAGMRLFYRAVGLVSDGVVVHTEELREKLRTYISDHKISVIPHGVSLPTPHHTIHDARSHLGITKNEVVLLVFGYINWYKGSDWICKVVGEFSAQNPEKRIRLIMAGGSSATLKDTAHYKKFYAKLQALQKQYASHISITGYVPDAEKELYFLAADLILLPYRVSMSESGPLSHAFGYGKPFMVSEARYSSLVSPDVVHAFYTHEIDPEKIVFKLTKKNFLTKLDALLQDTAFMKRLKNSARYIGEQRNWIEISKQYVRALHKGYARTAKKLAEQKEKLPELSVFFPLYNEEENVESLVHQALQTLPQIADTFEIILVNDGSTDTTKIICTRLAKKYKQVRAVHQKNTGYGGALKKGLTQARYDWIFFSDGDLQFDLNELASFVPFTKLHDLIIGYRIKRAEGAKRKYIASLLKLWNRVLLSFPLRIKDIDCAFKLMHRRVVNSVLPLECDGAMVSTELLAKAYQSGISFTQIGVSHYARAAGTATGSNFSVIKKAVYETIQLRRILKTHTNKSSAKMLPLLVS